MISVEVTGVTAVIGWIDQISGGIEKERGRILAKLAVKQANLIKSGTRSGMDINGSPFKPLVLRLGTPLDDTGKMLAAVHAIELNDNSAAVIVGSAMENNKGLIHQLGSGIYNENGSTGRIQRRSGGRALGPIKMKARSSSLKTRKVRSRTIGKLFFTSVDGTPVRKWFGFRPGDKEKLIDEAEILLKEFVEKMKKGK